jgi:hypothetical protein
VQATDHSPAGAPTPNVYKAIVFPDGKPDTNADRAFDQCMAANGLQNPADHHDETAWAAREEQTGASH